MLNNLGVEAHLRGHWVEATAYYADSARRSRAAATPSGPTAANNLAEVLSDRGHLGGRGSLFERVR